MQRPRVMREVLMLVASFILSPIRCSLQRSEPARSHTVSLENERSKHGSARNNVQSLSWLELNLLADVQSLAWNGIGVDVQDADGEDAVAKCVNSSLEML